MRSSTTKIPTAAERYKDGECCGGGQSNEPRIPRDEKFDVSAYEYGDEPDRYGQLSREKPIDFPDEGCQFEFEIGKFNRARSQYL